MTIKAYEFLRTWDEVPITIFAKDPEQAGVIFKEWSRTHHPDHPAKPLEFYGYGGKDLAARPLLASAAVLGEAGVGYWKPAKRAWVIAQPQDTPLGHLAPPDPAVSFYRVETDDGEDAFVFAASFEQATNLFVACQLDRWGEAPSWFAVYTRSRWELLGEQATLRDDMDREITGVAGVDDNDDWRVLPPDWEPSFERE